MQFFFPEGMPEELSPVLKQYKDTLEQHTSEDPTHLIGYLQTMQLAILSGFKLAAFSLKRAAWGLFG